MAVRAHHVIALSVITSACASRPPPPDWPVSSPAELCDDPALDEGDFCMPVERLEAWLKAPQLTITRSALSATGVTAPRKIRIETAEGLSFNAKFKPVPDDLDAFNNSPRRELAAYRVQHHFLEPDEFVVPPTMLRCLPIADHQNVIEDLEPFGDGDCALGIVAFWVEDISGEGVIDRTDWVTDPASVSYTHLTLPTIYSV